MTTSQAASAHQRAVFAFKAIPSQRLSFQRCPDLQTTIFVHNGWFHSNSQPSSPPLNSCVNGAQTKKVISQGHTSWSGDRTQFFGFSHSFNTLRVSIFLQHFVMKNVQHTEKLKEFDSSHLSITWILPLTLLNHVAIHLALHLSLCLIFDTFQRELKTSVQFPLNLSACTSSPRI